MRTLAVLVVGAILMHSRSISAQNGVIVGRVVAKGADLPLGYSVVNVMPGAREQFTTAEGRFVIRGLPRGRITVTAKHIAYAPLDTALTIAGADTINVTLALSLVTIQLPAIHSLAKACAHPDGADSTVGLELAALFTQVKENAARHQLLSRSYPFEIDVERMITKPEPALEARFVAYDTLVRSSVPDWHYAPGKMMGTREYTNGVFAGKWSTVRLPELADFANEPFLLNHCFDYGGAEVVNGDTLLRIDFVPAPAIHSPDVAGAIFLDRKTFQLRTTELTLVNLTKAMRETLAGQSIRADFKEVIPGVPVVDRVSSVVFPRDDPKAPPVEPATEIHRTLAVRFLGGRP
jgi:Carboxypeptidase regulatory-like domain